MKTVCANCGSTQGRFDKSNGFPLCRDVQPCNKRRDTLDAERYKNKS